MLKNAKVVIRTKDYIDETPITKNFEGVKFEDGKEFTCDF